MEELFNKVSILETLYEIRGEGLENYYIQKYGEPEERKNLNEAEGELIAFINKYVKDKNMLFITLNDYQGKLANEIDFWNKQYYKLGFIDSMNLKEEAKDIHILKNNDKETFFADGNSNMSNYLEKTAIRQARDREDYKDKLKTISEIKEKFVKVMKFIENGEITELTKEELEGVYKILRLSEDLAYIERQEIFKLGIKNGMMML